MTKKEPPRRGIVQRFLDGVERVGNKLPDPVLLFLILLVLTWIASAILAPIQFEDVHPQTGEPVRVTNQLTPTALTQFLVQMVPTFTGFAPLGVVLVALLGVGVAEHTGFINAGLKQILSVTPQKLLTPMLILAAIVSHTAADAGYVLVIPLGGVIFYAAGRHPLAGIAAAFAGVSGGFSANFIPSGIDPLLQGFTQSAAQIFDPDKLVNPLCNLAFTAASSVLVILVGWYLTDRVIEPRLASTEVDGDPEDMPQMQELGPKDKRGLIAGVASAVLLLVLLFLACLPEGSPLRAPDGSLTAFTAPLMRMIVPLIFIFFIVPGIVHGLVAGTVKSGKDVVDGMSKAMGTMAYYIAMTFFVAQFIAAFTQSNVGLLIALKGASFLRDLALAPQITIVGIILLTAFVNLFVGSASAKWALLSTIFVPMLMDLGISPELTQAAYRVGDSTTNIITPLMPYFPLVVVFCQRYVKKTGIGTLTSLMIPYSATLLVSWTFFLIVYWLLGIPLGLQAEYTYP
ncbi:MAG TPA: AbgT family transporter [Thermoanaerobaculia bacterium]|nr:AbgT family transporter [Thermoanaerobaculia bacterium]